MINVEIQLKNEYNMIKRSLYYWSKLYEEQIDEGEDYTSLKRTVCINILNFKYLNNDRFHNGYRLKEIETNEQLSDVMEIHFIEIPKLDKNSDEKDLLHRLSADEKQRILYEMRAKRLRDEISALNKAKREGIQEGIQQGLQQGEKNKAVEIAKSLIDLLPIEIIAEKTGLSVGEVKDIIKE